MKRLPSAIRLVLCASLCAPALTSACGEGMFNHGSGLSYRGYLAPRPATVLVYAAPGDAAARGNDALYSGLVRAGHTLTVVESPEALTEALRDARFDVVFTAYVDIGVVEASSPALAPAPRLVPVIPRADKASRELRDRFDLFVLDGASVGQYLSAISGAMKVAAK